MKLHFKKIFKYDNDSKWTREKRDIFRKLKYFILVSKDNNIFNCYYGKKETSVDIILINLRSNGVNGINDERYRSKWTYGKFSPLRGETIYEISEKEYNFLTKINSETDFEKVFDNIIYTE